MTLDPYYTSVPAQFLIDAVKQRTGLNVVIDPRIGEGLQARIERTKRILRITPGLDIEPLLLTFGKAILHEMFGPEALPGFQPVQYSIIPSRPHWDRMAG